MLSNLAVPFATFAVGALAAYWVGRGRRAPRAEDAGSADSLPLAEPSGRVAVPVCTHTPTELMHAVARLYRSCPLTLVHVVEVPGDLPLEAGLPPMEEEELRAMIEELRDTAETDLGATVSVEVLHGRDPARTLLDWIHRTKPQVVVLSLHSQRPDLSPTALSVLRDAQAQVWVWRGTDLQAGESRE